MSDRRARLRATFRAAAAGVLMAAALPVPGCEPADEAVVPRPGAGEWMDLHRRYVERARSGGVDLLFLGDSITQFWGDNAVWRAYYGRRNAAHFGIGGDTTRGLLWRVRHGELDGLRPRVVVVLIGTNNLSDDPVEDISLGVHAIVAEVRRRLPGSRVLVLGLFPKGELPGPLREKIRRVNERVATLDDGSRVRFLDIGRVFLEADGTLSRAVMPDFLHLSLEGYRRWAEAIEATLRAMLGESTVWSLSRSSSVGWASPTGAGLRRRLHRPASVGEAHPAGIGS